MRIALAMAMLLFCAPGFAESASDKKAPPPVTHPPKQSVSPGLGLVDMCDQILIDARACRDQALHPNDPVPAAQGGDPRACWAQNCSDARKIKSCLTRARDVCSAAGLPLTRIH